MGTANFSECEFLGIVASETRIDAEIVRYMLIRTKLFDAVEVCEYGTIITYIKYGNVRIDFRVKDGYYAGCQLVMEKIIYETDSYISTVFDYPHEIEYIIHFGKDAEYIYKKWLPMFKRRFLKATKEHFVSLEKIGNFSDGTAIYKQLD